MRKLSIGLSLISLLLLTSFSEARPGRPERPDRPDRPGRPGDDYRYGYYQSCPLEFNGTYYYVSKNGSRFTDLTSSLDQALNKQNDLVNAQICDYTSRSPGMCQVSYNGTYYYVTRNASRFSNLFSSMRSAEQVMDQLIGSGNCERDYDVRNDVCDIAYNGTYYYVTKNSSRFSGLYSRYEDAINFLDDSLRSRICSESRSQKVCDLAYNGTYYYITLNSSRFSGLHSNLDSALDVQDRFLNDRICDQPRNYPNCSIEYNGSYYYVSRNGSRFSGLYSSMSSAQNILITLQRSGNCY